MKKHIRFILFALFVSCTPVVEELDKPFLEGQEVTISATIAEQRPQMLPGMQRVSGKDTNPTNPNKGTIHLTWDKGDKILVTIGDKSAVFTLESGAGTQQATFRGTMPADDTSYSVSYPVNYTEDVLTIQPYVENGFGKGLMKMSTKTNGTIDNGFTLSADNALLGLQLTGDVIISKIVITNKDNNNTYTLDCSAQEVRATDEQVFYIVLPAGTWSKGMKLEVYNAEDVVIETKEKNDEITFFAKNATVMPEVEVHDFVDLGLSVKWATCNLGATSPEEYGDYIAWGETEPKEEYSWSTYKWCNGTKTSITKYNATDGLTTLLPEDDAAHVNWGGQWRMPTKEELTELRVECSWEWMTINGIKGNKVTGPNGNSIFLPAGGSYNTFNDQLNSLGQHGWLYSSTKSSVDNQAQEMGMSSGGAAQTSCSRCLGLNIRPVLDAHDYVDLGLSVLWATCNVGATSPEEYGDYFAWGETEPKEEYGWSTYKWSDATGTIMTKYNATDGLTTLLPEDDAAHVKWGGQWRMPTLNEFAELVENTSWENMQINGVKGYLVRSTVPGYTDKHIFLPFAGWRNEDLSTHVYEQGISTRYWSNYATHNDCAYNFFNRSRSNNSRRSGLSIRPVLPKN